jgi:ribose 5-phosphate isomerase A
MSSSTDHLKQVAAAAAADQLHDGQIVGLGSGSTAALAIAAIGKRVAQGLQIVGVSTSEKSTAQARELKIPLATLADHPVIDITIDGADDVELGTLNLIKGGGGNLLREKIVAASSKQLLIVVDRSKIVERLGSHSPVPVEIVPFGWEATAKRLEDLNAHPKLRTNADGSPYITDGGHYIVDCAIGPIASAAGLSAQLDSVVGVVEHGLFIGLASEVLIGTDSGIESLRRS